MESLVSQMMVPTVVVYKANAVRLRQLQALERGADEAEEVVEKKGAKNEKGHDDNDGGDGVGSSKPSKPHGKQVLAEAESPVAERLRNGVDGSPRGGFGS